MKLTKHFSLSEFTQSATATSNHIDNTPSIEVIENLQYLCQEILEPMRNYFNEPIVISSGYRCPALNRAVRGAPNSNHLYGYAADIRLPSKHAPNGSEVQDFARGREYLLYILANHEFDELIWEHDRFGNYWIHVAIKRNGLNRQRYVPQLLKQ